MNKRVEKIYKFIYNSAFKKIFDRTDIRKASQKGNKTYFKNKINNLKHSRDFNKMANKYALSIANSLIKNDRRVLQSEYIKAKRNKQSHLPSTYKDYELKLIEEAAKENFKLIKSIPDEIMKLYEYKYINDLIYQVVVGRVSRGTFERTLKESGAKNAKVISRTETAKIQTFVAEKKSTSLGSVCYIWRSSNDPRTRPSHKEMNNVVVFWRNNWDEKPLLDKMNGNAGEFPNCRCYTKAVYDENDLDKSNYRVWDYRENKIINMTKKQLLEYINKGEL